MPIGLGLASSHAPGMYVPEDLLQPAYEGVIARSMDKGNVIPKSANAITKEVLPEHWTRFRNGHSTLRKQLEGYNPDAVIFVGGDQNEMFDSSNKVNAHIFVGPEASGINPYSSVRARFGTVDWAKPENLVRYKTDVELANFLANELIVREHFDISVAHEFKALSGGRSGAPKGLPHAFYNLAEIMPRPDLPTVLIYVNTYDPPAMISAARCYDLGRALARTLEKDKRRIAILGSGGLTHDPGGPRNPWADQPLDKWVLEQISTGNGEALKEMFVFDSMTLRGGTGEIRAWITVAGAMEYMKSKAKVVDYLGDATELQCGVGFAYWNT